MKYVLAMILVCSSAHLLAGEAVIGTWKLNVEKSRFVPGPGPKSEVRVYSMHPDGIKVTIKTVGADGRTTSVEHPVNYDGKEHPLSGSSAANAILLERIDDYTSEAVLKHANRILGTNRRTVAKDGKTMTITYEGTDSRIGTVKNTAVYDRQ